MIFDGGTPDGANAFSAASSGKVDSFTLSSRATIESFRIWIHAFDPFNGTVNVRIFADDSGLPGAPIVDVPATVFSFTPTGNFPFGPAEMELVCDLETPQTLDAGNYWFQVRLNGNCPNNAVHWGTGGTGFSLSTNVLDCDGPFRTGDPNMSLAFQLFGSVGEECLPSVLVLYSESFISCPPIDLKAVLDNSGQFGVVSVRDQVNDPADLAELLEHDVVVVYTGGLPFPAGTGDLLADYFDAGGGVLDGASRHSTTTLGGRWVSGGYTSINPTGSFCAPRGIGTVHVPAHPMMAGISAVNFDCGTAPSATVIPGATLIAAMTDGSPAVLTRSVNGRDVVQLGFNLVPAPCANSYTTATDGDELVVNAVLHAAGCNDDDDPEPPCDTPNRGEYRTPSVGAEDGYVREPNMITMAEGPAVAKGTVAQVGDDGANWQNRGVFSFDTSGIPADATITTVTLRLTRAGSAGNVAGLGALVLDMGGALIGANAGLDSFDYDDASAAFLDVATSFPAPGGNGFTTFAELDAANFDAIDRDGTTQFRVRFATPSDDDNGADYITFHTGEAAALVRPELIVNYDLPDCVEFPENDPCDGPFQVTLWSLPAQDGGVGESHYTSEVGGSIGAGAGTAAVGDTGARAQQKLLLHFDTSSIPSDATVTSATLRLYRSSAVGTPATSLGDLVVDMRNPYAGDAFFGTSDALEAADFQSFAHFSGVATLTVPLSNTYTESFLDATGLEAINKGGNTQMRVRFTLPDDGDFLADQVSFGTGNFGATSPGRPRLVVTYMTPCP